MATLTVRHLSSQTHQALKQRAAINGRSMEAEARAILDEAVGRPNHIAHWLERARDLRGDGFESTTRTPPREVDLA